MASKILDLPVEQRAEALRELKVFQYIVTMGPGKNEQKNLGLSDEQWSKFMEAVEYEQNRTGKAKSLGTDIKEGLSKSKAVTDNANIKSTDDDRNITLTPK